MITDKIEKIGQGTIIHHGDLNKRVYLMKLDKRDIPGIIGEVNRIARSNRYTKIICKVPQSAVPQFIADGFLTEAQIPLFYEGRETAFFMSKFLSSDRLLELETEQLQFFGGMLEKQNGRKNGEADPDNKYNVKRLTPADSEDIVAIYRDVFESYPFPIFDPNYIKETMESHVEYFGVEHKGKLLALASAEMDKKGLNAEMTDFATPRKNRGKKLALLLLDEMEKQMKKQGLKTLYTMARLNSVGMNKTFLRKGYVYSGTALKNTNIAGKIESLNIYYKHI